MNTKAKHLLFILNILLILLTPTSGAVALFFGIAWAIVLGNPYSSASKKYATTLMQIGIVCLGAGIDLAHLWESGRSSFFYTLAGVIYALFFGLLLGRALKTPRDTSILLTAGTAICGGSAIAATAVTIRAKASDISLALAIVFTLNAVALVVFPPLGHALGFSERQFGLLAALAIHDTSSVVGAGMAYGPLALDVATTGKLTRMLWIIPVALFLGYISRHHNTEGGNKFKIPWFIGWFVVASAIVTYLPELQPLGHKVHFWGKRILMAALFLIGSNLDPKSLRTIGLRPLLQGIALWFLVTAGAIGAILLGWIA